MILKILIICLQVWYGICNQCQSQDFYKRNCHESYVKKFRIDRDLGQIFSISEDHTILGIEIDNTDNVIKYEGHRSNLVDFSIYQNILYSVNVQGDIIMFDIFSAKALQVYNCTQRGGTIQNKVYFSSTYQYFLYYDIQQINVNAYSLKEGKTLTSLVTPNSILLDIIEDSTKGLFAFIFESSSYVIVDINQQKSVEYSLLPNILKVTSTKKLDRSFGSYIYSQQQQVFCSVDFSKDSSSPIINQIQISLVNQTKKVFYFEEDELFFLSNNNNQIVSLQQNQTPGQLNRDEFKISFFIAINNQTEIEISGIKKFNQNVYIASSVIGIFIKIDLNQKSLDYIQTFTYYEISFFEILDGLLIYALKSETKGIIIYSMNTQQITSDLSCMVLPYNQNTVTNPLNINVEDDNFYLSHYAAVSKIDLTNFSLSQQMRVLQQRGMLSQQSFVYKEYDLIVIIDRDYLTLLSYWTLEVFSFYSVPNYVERKTISYENLPLKKLIIAGSIQLSLILLEIDIEKHTVQTLTQSYEEPIVIITTFCYNMYYDFDLDRLVCFRFYKILIFELDRQKLQLIQIAELAPSEQGYYYFSAKVDHQNKIAYVIGNQSGSFQSAVTLVSLTNLDFINQKFYQGSSFFSYFQLYKDYNLVLILNLWANISFNKLDDINTIVMSSEQVISNQDLVIQAEEFIYLQLPKSVQQFNMLTFNTKIFSYSEPFTCFHFNNQRNILIIGFSDGTIIYGDKSLLNPQLILVKNHLTNIFLDPSSDQIIATKVMTKDFPSELITLKINKKEQIRINSINYNFPTIDQVKFIHSLNVMVLLQSTSLLIYDFRDGNLIKTISVKQYFNLYPYKLSDIIDQRKFSLTTDQEIGLFSLDIDSNNEFKLTAIKILSSDLYIDSLFSSYHVNHQFIQITYYGSDYHMRNLVLNVHNFSEIVTIDGNNCNFDCVVSTKHGMIGTISMFFFLQMAVYSIKENKVLAVFSIDENNFQGLGQIDQDYFYVRDSIGYFKYYKQFYFNLYLTIKRQVQFYSFSSLELVYEEKFLAGPVQYAYFNPDSMELFMVGYSFELYFGVIDLSIKKSEKSYVLQGESNSNLVFVDNLDLFITFDVNRVLIYQKSNGKLLKKLSNLNTMVSIKSLNLLAYWAFDTITNTSSYFLYDLSSLFDEKNYFLERNQAIVPLLKQQQEKAIYASSSIEGKLYRIDIQNQKIKFLLKRISQIHSIAEISDSIIMIVSFREIIIFDRIKQSLIFYIQYPNIQIKLLEVLDSSSIERLNFKIISAIKPQSIQILSIEGRDLNKNTIKDYMLSEQLREIIVLSNYLSVISHSSGSLTVLNTQSLQSIVQQNFHKIKYEVIYLNSYLKQDQNLNEIYYILTYSSDKVLQISYIQIKQDKSIDVIKVIFTKTFTSKILQLEVSKDQKYVFISCQDNIRIEKICIDCIIKDPTSLQISQYYQLTFMKYRFTFKLYEDIGYLLAYVDFMYVLFDLKNTYFIFASTAKFSSNIYEINVLTSDYVLISFYDSQELHKIDINTYLNNSLGYSEIVYKSSETNVKVFNAEIQLSIDENNVQSKILTLIGYNQIQNEIVFSYIPLIQFEQQYTCLETFVDPKWFQIQNKIDSYYEMNKQMNNKVGYYEFKIIQNKQQIDQKNKYYTNISALKIPFYNSNLKSSLTITGQKVYLDRISYDQLSLYYQSIHFQNAVLYILNNVVISGFQTISIQSCQLIILQENNADTYSFGIQFLQTKQVIIQDLTIQNQSIPKNYYGIQILSFDSVSITDLKILNCNFYSNSQFLLINNGQLLTVLEVFISGNQLEQNMNDSLVEIKHTEKIVINGLNILSNMKIIDETLNDINLNYLISIYASKDVSLKNGEIKDNTNCLFLYLPNIVLVETANEQNQIKFIQSILTLDHIFYESNNFSMKSSKHIFYFQDLFKVNINNCHFENNISINSYLLSFNQVNEQIISDSSFSKNQHLSSLYAKEGMNIQIIKTNFISNESPDSGSSLFLNNFLQNLNSVNIINNCHFSSNIAKNSGGAIYLENTDLQIINSSFNNNRAAIGGAIRYIGLIPQFVSKLQNQRFLQQQSTPDITFSENKAIVFGQNVGSIPNQLVFKDTNTTTLSIEKLHLKETRSGDIIKDKRIYLLDEEQNPINVIPNENVVLSEKISNEIQSYVIEVSSLNLNELEIKDTLKFNYTTTLNNTFNLDGMRLIGIPEKTSNFQIHAPFIRKDGLNNIYSIGNYYNATISFRNCKVGEIFQKISGDMYECSPCKNTTYLLAQPIKNSSQICLPCPFDVADQCNTNIIKVKKGFWRKSVNEDIIDECYNKPENCYGEEDLTNPTSIKNYCSESYIGTLCEVCDSYGEVWGERYGRTDKFSCSPCKKYTDILLRKIVEIIFLSLYLLYSVKKAVDKASKYIICQTLRRLNFLLIGKTGEKDQVSFYIKLLINFVQISSVISNSRISFLKFSFFDISGVVGSPQSLQSNSIDCFLAQSESIPVEYGRGIWVSVQPIFFLFIALSIYLISVLKTLKKPDHKRFFYVAYTFGFIQFQSGTATQLVLIMSCLNIGGISYIKSQINKQCYTDEHLNYTFSLILPLFLIWVFVIPAFILWRIFLKRNVLNEPIQVYKYGFICSDYKHKYFFWEFFRIILRLLIVIIGNILSDEQITLKAFLSIILIQIYNYFLNYLNPYISKQSKNLDYQFNQILCLQYLLYQLQLTNSNTAIQETSSLFQFLIYIISYLSFILLVASHTVNNNPIVNKAILSRFPFLKRVIKKPSVSLKKFFLWKKIKDHFDTFKNEKKDQKILDSQRLQSKCGANDNNLNSFDQITIKSNPLSERNPMSPQQQAFLSKQNSFGIKQSFTLSVQSPRNNNYGTPNISFFKQQTIATKKFMQRERSDSQMRDHISIQGEDNHQNEDNQEEMLSNIVLEDSIPAAVNSPINDEFKYQSSIRFSKAIQLTQLQKGHDGQSNENTIDKETNSIETIK